MTRGLKICIEVYSKLRQVSLSTSNSYAVTIYLYLQIWWWPSLKAVDLVEVVLLGMLSAGFLWRQERELDVLSAPITAGHCMQCSHGTIVFPTLQ